MSFYLTFLVLVAGLAQTDAATPPEQATRILEMKNGETMAVFWEDRQELGNDSASVKIDDPLKDSPPSRIVKHADIVRNTMESKGDREKRIEEAWKQAGFLKVNGRYVDAKEVQCAQRARKMAGITEKGSSSPSPTSLSEEQPTPKASAPVPQRLWMWRGVEAGIVLAALALAGMVVKTTFL